MVWESSSPPSSFHSKGGGRWVVIAGSHLHLLQLQRPFSKQATTVNSEKNDRPLWEHSSHAQPSVLCAVVLSRMEVEGLVNPEAEGWQSEGKEPSGPSKG